MATDEELYGQYLCGDETGLELLIKKYGDPLTLYIDGYLHAQKNGIRSCISAWTS